MPALLAAVYHQLRAYQRSCQTIPPLLCINVTQHCRWDRHPQTEWIHLIDGIISQKWFGQSIHLEAANYFLNCASSFTQTWCRQLLQNNSVCISVFVCCFLFVRMQVNLLYMPSSCLLWVALMVEGKWCEVMLVQECKETEEEGKQKRSSEICLS